MEQKGSKLLKIVSIIMMIGGIVSAVFSVIAAALAGVGTAVMTQLTARLPRTVTAAAPVL